MSISEINLIGLGIYTVPEASRLTGVASARIKRWVTGYDFKTAKGERHYSSPVWKADLEPIGEAIALSFKDLVEIRFIDSFLSFGVSWKELRSASVEATKLLANSHPFSTHKFKTDGRKIFADIGERTNNTKLLELTKKQYVFRQVVLPSLYDGFEYKAGELLRWRPKGGQKLIVLDPQRSFGQPITDVGSVPTSIIYRAVKAEGLDSEIKIARWYDIPISAVRAAVAFENELSAHSQIKSAA